MNSKKCTQCGLVNHPTTDFCIRCSAVLQEQSQNSNCPGCGNLCSATPCPICGYVLQAAPIYINQPTPPKKNWTLSTVLVTIVVLTIAILGILRSLETTLFGHSSPAVYTSQPQPKQPQPTRENTIVIGNSSSFNETARQNSPSPEARKKYALGLEASVDTSKTSIKNLKFTTEGAAADILLITADGLDDPACSPFGLGDYGKTAAAIGFKYVHCLDREGNFESTANISFIRF